MILTRMNRTEEAVGYFRKALELDPKSAGAHLNLGIAMADQFDLEGALAEFRKPCVWSPIPLPAHYNKGRVLLDLAPRCRGQSLSSKPPPGSNRNTEKHGICWA